MILIAILVSAGILISKRKIKPGRTSGRSVGVGLGIVMSAEDTALEEMYNAEILRLVVASGYVKPEKLTELMSHLRRGSVAFGRTNTSIAFGGDLFLTVEEKRTLGLNTRMKYSRTYIEYFDPESFRTIEPKSFLSGIHLDSFHRVARLKELQRFKVLAGIKRVRLQPDHDCPVAKALKIIYAIDSVPELPAPGCRQTFCRCYFSAIIPGVSSRRT